MGLVFCGVQQFLIERTAYPRFISFYLGAVARKGLLRFASASRFTTSRSEMVYVLVAFIINVYFVGHICMSGVSEAQVNIAGFLSFCAAFVE